MVASINDAARGQLKYAGSYQAANGSDNTVLYTSGDISWANIHIFEGVANAADVFVSLDGTNFASTPVFMVDVCTDDGSGATHANAIAANKVYILEGQFAKLKIQNAGAAQATVKVAHGVKM